MHYPSRIKLALIGAGTVAALSATGAWAQANLITSADADTPEAAGNDLLGLPLDAYQPSPSQQAAQANLDNVITRACMRGYGISYLANVPDITSRLVASTAAADSRRYGISDADSAKRRGYHLPPELWSPDVPRTATTEEKLTADQQRVLTGQAPSANATKFSDNKGPVGSYKGKKIPRNGCVGEAARILREPMTDESTRSRSMFAANLQQELFLRLRTHPRVVPVFKQWSTCMAGHGYRYSDPIAAATDDRWDLTKPSTSEEVRTAVADVDCKQKTALVTVEHRVEVDLQKTAIEQNAAKLEPLKKAVADQLSALRQAEARYR